MGFDVSLRWLKRKWQWLAFSLIAIGGVVFSILTVLFQWIDAESGRYLLSAIVQALAALLAIIFAGVAILWSHEEFSKSKLGILKEKTIDLFRKKDSQGEYKFLNTLKDYLREYRKLDDEHKKRIKPAMFNLVKLYFSYGPKITDIIIQGEFTADNLEGLDEFLGGFEEEGKLYSEGYKDVESFFVAVKSILELPNSTNWRCTYDIAKEITRSLTWLHSHVNYEELDRVVKEAETCFVKVKRATETRGGFFKFLVAIYTLTIAGGIVSLSILRKGVSEAGATWIAIWPLGLAVISLAFTFIYLYNVVSGGKKV